MDLAWGTEFSIHSISFLATGVSRVQVILQGRKGERGSWFGAGSTPSTFAVATNAIEAYDGVLPTAAECKRWLTCKSEGDGLRPLAPKASGQAWCSPRCQRGREGRLRKQVNRQPVSEPAPEGGGRQHCQPAGSCREYLVEPAAATATV